MFDSESESDNDKENGKGTSSSSDDDLMETDKNGSDGSSEQSGEEEEVTAEMSAALKRRLKMVRHSMSKKKGKYAIFHVFFVT